MQYFKKELKNDQILYLEHKTYEEIIHEATNITNWTLKDFIKHNYYSFLISELWKPGMWYTLRMQKITSKLSFLKIRT